MKRRIYLLNCFAATLLLSGCMGYQLGGSRPAGIRTVYVNPVINQTRESAIELQVARALRERLQFDGRFELMAEPGQADAIIDAKLTQYAISPIAYRSDLKTAAKEYRIRITGDATLKQRKSGEILSESATYGETIFEFESDLTTSKRNALPRAARELAKFMVDDLIERW